MHVFTQGSDEKNYKQFMIVKPSLTDDQCHPEEGVYSLVTEEIWRTHMMDDGIIEDDFQIRKVSFGRLCMLKTGSFQFEDGFIPHSVMKQMKC